MAPPTGSREMIRTAMRKKEYVKLLTGAPGYCYLDKYTPAPGKTDLTLVFQHMLVGTPEQEMPQLRADILAAFHDLRFDYDGIDPLAVFILCEASDRASGQRGFGVDLLPLANMLRDLIDRYRERLRMDQTECGAGRPEGRLDDLRGLSRTVVQDGGPGFCE